MEKNYIKINEATIGYRNKVVLPDFSPVINHNNEEVINAVINLMKVGVILSPEVIDELEKMDAVDATVFARMVISIVSEAKGMDYSYVPLNPGYFTGKDLSAIVTSIRGYVSGSLLGLPELNLEEAKYQVLSLGTYEDYKAIVRNLVTAAVPFSQKDLQTLEDYFMYAPDAKNIFSELKSGIPCKENLVSVIELANRTSIPSNITAKLFKTATDVLRYVTFKLTNGAQITSKTRFKNITRKDRKFILSVLEAVSKHSRIEEDMLVNREIWVRLGEVLHPGEYAKAYPKTYEVFTKLRNKVHIDTFSSKLEAAYAAKDVNAVVKLLVTRPGVFARNLDRTIRMTNDASVVVDAFRKVAGAIPTPLLLQLREYFAHRDEIQNRTFVPKGNVSKVYSIPAELAPIDKKYCTLIVKACENAIVKNLSEKPGLGNVYISPEMKHYAVPAAQRTASKALKTIARGSSFPIPDDVNIIRPFIYWINGNDRVDIDLSTVFFDDDFGHVDTVAYYSLGNFRTGCVHSGDITDAPNGASEFIDINIKTCAAKARYAVVTISSYTQQPYCDLPICFGGWMERKNLNSGEIYEPLTVANRFDISGNMLSDLPIIIDLKERRIIWCDVGFSNDNFQKRQNDVKGCMTGILATVRSIVEGKVPSLYDLYVLNAQARGILVDTPEEADTILSEDENATVKPTDLDIIMSEYM